MLLWNTADSHHQLSCWNSSKGEDQDITKETWSINQSASPKYWEDSLPLQLFVLERSVHHHCPWFQPLKQITITTDIMREEGWSVSFGEMFVTFIIYVGLTTVIGDMHAGFITATCMATHVWSHPMDTAITLSFSLDSESKSDSEVHCCLEACRGCEIAEINTKSLKNKTGGLWPAISMLPHQKIAVSTLRTNIYVSKL